jgi:probable phosphoglycerate mutase
MKKINVYFDGAANLREKCGYGFLIKDGETWITSDYGNVPVEKERATCNVAEHYALLQALKWLVENDYTKDRIDVYGDSKLVINQIFGHWRIRNRDLPYADYCLQNMEILKKFENIKGSWIPREKNRKADELSKLGIKEQ